MNRKASQQINTSPAYTTRFLNTTKDEDRLRWQKFQKGSPQGGPFCTLAYADAVADTCQQPYNIAVVEQKGSILAGVLLFEDVKGPYRTVTVPPFTAHTSVLLQQQPTEADIHRHRTPLDELLKFLDQQYHQLTLLLHPSLQDVRSFAWQQWQLEPLYTYHLPLTKPSEQLMSWSSSRRYNFRKKRSSYKICELTETTRPVVKLCEKSYKRSSRALPGGSISQITALADRLLKSGAARAFTATPEKAEAQTPTAGVVVLTSDRQSYYWIAGSIPGPAMSVLLGSLFERLYHEGYRKMDLMGANTPSIAEFKRRFGPKLVSYFRARRIVRPELNLWHLIRRCF